MVWCGPIACSRGFRLDSWRAQFALAPGMGLNSYFAYGVCVAKGLPSSVALPTIFVMGLSFALLSVTGACSFIQRVMPGNLKHAITVGIGLFQAFIGFRMGACTDARTQH